MSFALGPLAAWRTKIGETSFNFKLKYAHEFGLAGVSKAMSSRRRWGFHSRVAAEPGGLGAVITEDTRMAPAYVLSR